MENILERTNLQTISGLGLNLEASWDQNRGIEPRICTTELILPLHDPASSSRTICSISTSLATLPQSFTPLFKYLNTTMLAQCRKEILKEENSNVSS